MTVYDFKRLKSVTETARERRQNAAECVETIIDEAMVNLLDLYKRQRIEGVISGMYNGAERIKRQQLDTAFSKLESNGDLTDEQAEVIESMAEALVSQLLVAPSSALREAAVNDDWTSIETAIRLFDPATDVRGQETSETINLADSMEAAEIGWATDTGDDD